VTSICVGNRGGGLDRPLTGQRCRPPEDSPGAVCAMTVRIVARFRSKILDGDIQTGERRMALPIPIDPRIE
jgi:hypothetical protein